VGSKLGEANCYLALGRVALQQEDYQKALTLHTSAYQLYRKIQDGYSQARLLYYRSMVYEAMQELRLAIEDMQNALAIAQSLDLPFLDLFQERLDDLQAT
jgi:tetratricopeptide (TPR) repeat protein